MSDLTGDEALPPAPFKSLSASQSASSPIKRPRVDSRAIPPNDEVFWVNVISSATASKALKDLPKPVWDRMPWSPSASPFRSEPVQHTIGFSDVMSRASSSSNSLGDQQALPLKAFPDFIERRLKLSSMSDPKAERLHCLQKLRTMVMLDPPQSELGSSLVDAAGKLVGEEIIVKSFRDAFAPKATSTLVKRTSYLWGYCSFVTTRNLGSPLAFTESVVYIYLEDMRESGRGATAPSSFIEAIGFLHGTVRLSCFKNGFLISARCKGIATSEWQRKRVTKQSEVLSADQVWQLERFAVSEAPSLLALICGHILFCLYSCARWGDSMYIQKIEEFVSSKIVLIETATSHHKTAKAAKDASLFLPLLCLGKCLYDKPWSTAWLKCRAHFKLDQSKYGLPSYSEKAGKFLDEPMSSSEASLWLRELLCLTGTSEQEAARISSHGLKATLLSWCAKSGKFSDTEQRCLGHHYDPELKSVLVYSRDTYSPLAAKIHLMLKSIRNGSFNLDAPRTELIESLIRAADSSSGESEISEPDLQANTLLKRGDGRPLPVPEGLGKAQRDQIFVHAASGIAHVSLDKTKLLCGRPLMKVYQQLDAVLMEPADLQICKQCGRSV